VLNTLSDTGKRWLQGKDRASLPLSGVAGTLLQATRLGDPQRTVGGDGWQHPLPFDACWMVVLPDRGAPGRMSVPPGPDGSGGPSLLGV
jgi:hypothetical protein